MVSESLVFSQRIHGVTAYKYHHKAFMMGAVHMHIKYHHHVPASPNTQGLYSSSSYHDSALGFLAHVFEEDLTVVQLPAPHDPPQKQQHADDAAQHDQDEKQQKTLTDDVQHVEKNHDVQKPVCSHDNDAHYGVIESDDEGGDERDIPVGPTVRVVGPAMPSAEEMAVCGVVLRV